MYTSLLNTGVDIHDPHSNTIVFYHPPKRNKEPYPVLIVEGHYFNDGGVSNFWVWLRIKKSGKISKKVKRGYGNFTQAIGWYEVKVKRTIIFETPRIS